MIRNIDYETQWAICTAWLDTGRTPVFADVEEAVVLRVLSRAGFPDPDRVTRYLRLLGRSDVA